MRTSLLQDYIVPICTATVSATSARYTRVFGTGFFINGEGVILTASHVLRTVQRPEAEGIAGISFKGLSSEVTDFFAPIVDFEYAPEPFDIAIIRIQSQSFSWFEIREERDSTLWKDAATLGYPNNALSIICDYFRINLRALKGYIQREVNDNEIPILGAHPKLYEISIPLSSGMSGAPLFTCDDNRQQLIGVCIGSYDSEMYNHSIESIADNGEKTIESKIRFEQISYAQSIFPLLSWRPKLLRGQSLGESIKVSMP